MDFKLFEGASGQRPLDDTYKFGARGPPGDINKLIKKHGQECKIAKVKKHSKQKHRKIAKHFQATDKNNTNKTKRIARVFT